MQRRDATQGAQSARALNAPGASPPRAGPSRCARVEAVLRSRRRHAGVQPAQPLHRGLAGEVAVDRTDEGPPITSANESGPAAPGVEHAQRAQRIELGRHCRRRGCSRRRSRHRSYEGRLAQGIQRVLHRQCFGVLHEQACAAAGVDAHGPAAQPDVGAGAKPRLRLPRAWPPARPLPCVRSARGRSRSGSRNSSIHRALR